MELFKKPTIHITLIVLLGILVYSNTFLGPFQFDDSVYIYNSQDIRELSRLWPPVGTRWFGTLTFALNYTVHGLDVTGYHALNLAIHLLAAIFLYSLVVVTVRTPFFEGSMSERNQRSVALFAALLFVSHPVQTQAVTYISQRFTSLAAMLYLLSLAAYVRFRLSTVQTRRYGFYGISIMSAVLAMKTKEIAFTIPILTVLYEFFFLNVKARPSCSAFATESNRKRILHLAPFLLTLFIIPLSLLGPDFGLYQPRESVDEQVRQVKLQEATSLPRYEYLITQFRVIVTYVRLLLFPINQNVDYDYPRYTSFFNLAVFLSFFFILLLLCTAIYLFRKSGDGHPLLRLPAFGIVWFFLTLSVESSVIPIKDFIFEHRVYLPSIGFFFAVAGCFGFIQARWDWHRIVNWAGTLIMITAVTSASIATFSRNKVWQSEFTLWQDVVRKSPNKSFPHYRLGLLYYYQDKTDEAVREFETTVSLEPFASPLPHYHLGSIYYDQGRLEDAERSLFFTIQLKPNSPYAHLLLGKIYAKQGRIKEAEGAYNTALSLSPGLAEARIQLSLLDQGKSQKKGDQ